MIGGFRRGGDRRQSRRRRAAELPRLVECRKYLVLCARASGQSSSSRHLLAPITKILTGFCFGELVLNAFEQEVVPLSVTSSSSNCAGCRSKVNFANFSAAAGMASNNDQQVLTFARPSLPPGALMPM